MRYRAAEEEDAVQIVGQQSGGLEVSELREGVEGGGREVREGGERRRHEWDASRGGRRWDRAKRQQGPMKCSNWKQLQNGSNAKAAREAQTKASRGHWPAVQESELRRGVNFGRQD
jgi:hypothetical protein